MNPHQRWCHIRRCRAYGRPGEPHRDPCQKERRYQCKRCRRTFSETTDTPFYRMHKPKWLVLAVVTLLAHGCPLQAIVAAFAIDERAVVRWQRDSGSQCRRIHEHLIEAGRVELLQVQADEIRVKAVGGVFWLASAIEVRSRLWLGSVISQRRDGRLIGGLLIRLRSLGPVEKILLVTDGLFSYKELGSEVFRKTLHTGKVGRPRLVLPAGVMIARVLKRYQRRRRVVEVLRHVIVGSQAAVISRVIGTQRSIRALINTAYIERLQATFRAWLGSWHAELALGPTSTLREKPGMLLVGACYKFLMEASLSLGGAHSGNGSGNH